MSYTTLPAIKAKPYNIIAVDMEQDENANPYLYIVAYRKYGRVVYKEFDDRGDVVKFLFKRRWPHTILTGMNLSFDLNPLIEYGFDWKVIVNQGSFISAFPETEESINKLQGKYCKVVDLSNFLYGKSLKDACKDIGYTGHVDKHILEKEGSDEMVRACKSHAEGALLVMEDMQAQINNMNTAIEITPALTAQRLHRRHFLDKTCQIFKSFTDDEMLFQFRSYFGGRTECFVKGVRHHVTGIDINSSYPNVMRNRDFPDMETFAIAEKTDLKTLFYFMDDREGLAKVKITTNDDRITLLPVIDDDKLIFPKGTFISTYTFPELRKALELGYTIDEVYQIGYAKRTKKPFFKGYVDELYKMKENPIYKRSAKLLLNSLYGKFGQKANENTGWVTLDQDEIEQVGKGEDIGFQVEYFSKVDQWLKFVPESDIEDRGFARLSVPLIAAYVTGYARIYLFDAMESIGFEYVYYCDTDSIYGDTQAIRDAIERGDIEVDDTKLGAWCVEHDDVTMEIRGLKYYRVKEKMEWEYTIKAVPKRYQRDFWRDRIIRVVRPNKLKSVMRSVLNKNSRILKLNMFEKHLKSDKRPDDKRYFISNKESYPILLSE